MISALTGQCVRPLHHGAAFSTHERPRYYIPKDYLGTSQYIRLAIYKFYVSIKKLVGGNGFEPMTSAMSTQRSKPLS